MMQSGPEQARLRLIEDNEIPPLPRGWEVQRFRFLFRESKERNGETPVGDMLSVSEYRGVVPKEYEHEEQRRTDEELQTYRVVRPGQLAVNTMWLNHLGLGVSEHLGHVSPAYAVYNISSELDTRFAHHLFRSQYYLKIYLRYLYGIRPNSFQIKADDWNSIPVIVPPLDTQKAIADFLDRETARIDQLIEKKQRLVALLEEREQNNLVHVFAELSDKNRIWKIAHLCLLQRGRFNHRPRNAPELYDGEHPFLQTGDVARAKKYILSFKQTLTDLGASVSAKFPRGTVLMAIAANVGDVAISEFDSFCPDSVVGFIPSKQLDREFLYYALRSLRPSIATSSTSNAQDNTNIARLGALKIPLPELSAQRQVVANLDHAETRSYALAKGTNASVERLQEFRSALITAAVTGQIDVATWGKQGQTDRRLDQIEADMTREAARA